VKLRYLSTVLIALSLLTACAPCSSAWATDFTAPDQKITGAEKPIALGEMVELTVPPVKDRPKFYASSAYDWKVIDLSTGKEKKSSPRDSSICFGSGIQNKKMVALCAATHVYIVKEGDKVVEVGTKTVLLTVEVTIGDDTVPPPPPDKPDDQSFPDGKYKLSKTTYGMSNSVPATKRAAGAKVLATSFRGIASSISAGALKDPQDILKKTTASNLAALTNAGLSRADWEPFFKLMMEAVYGFYEAGSLATPADFSTAWLEIAVGLEGMK
jgi:hypothetical protein